MCLTIKHTRGVHTHSCLLIGEVAPRPFIPIAPRLERWPLGGLAPLVEVGHGEAFKLAPRFGVYSRAVGLGGIGWGRLIFEPLAVGVVLIHHSTHTASTLLYTRPR